MRFLGFVALLLVVGLGLFMYQRTLQSLHEGTPEEQIDTVAIRQRLLTIAQTERTYQASNGKYASLEQLSSDNLLPGGTEQRGYTYTADVTSTGFTITATPTAANKSQWPTLTVTEAMQVTEK